MTIRCESCQLLIQDGNSVAHVGLCPWCWEQRWDIYQALKKRSEDYEKAS